MDEHEAPGRVRGGNNEHRARGKDSGAPTSASTDKAKSPLLWTIFGTALGLILLYAATRKLDSTTLLATLKAIDLRWALGVFAVNLCFIAIKAWRWGLLLRFVPGITFGRLHSAVYAGLAVNFLVAHIGELLRASLIARGSRAPTGAVFASVVVERALDFIALLVILTIVSLSVSELPEFMRTARIITAVFILIAVVGLYVLRSPPRWVEQWVAAVSRPLPTKVKEWSLRQLELFRRGLGSIDDVRLMALAIAVSVVQWSMTVAAIWLSGVAVGEPVTLAAAGATFVLIIIGLTLPNAPMQVGTTQLAFAVGFGTAGTPPTTAIAASLVYTVFLILPVMIIGGACLLRGQPASPTDTARADS